MLFNTEKELTRMQLFVAIMRSLYELREKVGSEMKYSDVIDAVNLAFDVCL